MNVNIEHGRESSEDEKIDHINNKPKTDINTIIVFDYDDTIFPTTAIKQIFQRYNPYHSPINHPSKWNQDELLKRINAKELNELMQLSCITLNLLMAYIAKYSTKNIFIVSAATSKWFQHSLSIVKNIGFYQQIFELLTNFGIQKFHPSSASDLRKNKNATTKWKYNQFKSILNCKKIFSDKNKNNEHSKINTFVSIGDSGYEYQAAGYLTNTNNNDKINKFFVHRIKLIDHPSINALNIEQRKLYESCLYFEHYSTVNKINIDQDYKQWINKQQK